MVLKLYGIYKSPLVRLVAAICLEKQVPFELVSVDLANGEHKSPEYLAKHPYGQVPYIDDDGFILYESKAICYYIASKYPDQGTPLLLTGIQANALYQQAVFVEFSHFHLHGMLAAGETSGRQRLGLPPNKEAYEKHIIDLGGKLDVYEKILSKQKYLLGDEISLVDFYHLPVGSHLPIDSEVYLEKLGNTMDTRVDILESKPNVARWIKDLCSRDSWVSTQEGTKE